VENIEEPLAPLCFVLMPFGTKTDKAGWAGRHYYVHEKTLNSLVGMRSYNQIRRILRKAAEELAVLDRLPDALTMHELATNAKDCLLVG